MPTVWAISGNTSSYFQVDTPLTMMSYMRCVSRSRIGISKRQRRRAICAEVRWTGSGAVGGQGFRQRHAIFAAN
ncbi:MAG: hypothetical protein VB137_16710, partial [Burkholderia sp.]